MKEASAIEIVAYQPHHQAAFKAINEEWISTYFKMEKEDYKALDHPQTYILDNGGYILMALCDGVAAGTCALIRMDHPKYDFELAKMGVSPAFRGRKIGWLIGQATIDKARDLGAKALYLESNRVLTPAINLYRKLGFVEVFGVETPYERCDIQMELVIPDKKE